MKSVTWINILHLVWHSKCFIELLFSWNRAKVAEICSVPLRLIKYFKILNTILIWNMLQFKPVHSRFPQTNIIENIPIAWYSHYCVGPVVCLELFVFLSLRTQYGFHLTRAPSNTCPICGLWQTENRNYVGFFVLTLLHRGEMCVHIY